MPLNIKDETVHAKARELARLTGSSITAAVRDAIDERLAALQPQGPHIAQGDVRALRLFIAAQLGETGETSEDHAALYGDDGLPR